MSYKITLLPGDGIGPDVTLAAVDVLTATASAFPALSFTFKEYPVGAGEYLVSGTPLPQESFNACREADAVLLGAMGLPSVRWENGKEMTPQIDLREQLDLYAGLRPIKLYHPDDSPLKGYGGKGKPIDFVIVRENTEGLFSARLNKEGPGGSDSRDVMRITRKGAERICRCAFDLARERRRKCTLVDKANVLPSMVFFRRIFDEVGASYPDVEKEHVYVDAMALFLVRKPEAFDVIVTENMFGDILSDLAAGIIGGMGMAPSADIGEDCAIFQPSHGSAPDIAGKDIANPVATILSAAMMLDWLEEKEAAAAIERAVATVLSDPASRTPDMGGTLSTRELTKRIIAEITQ